MTTTADVVVSISILVIITGGGQWPQILWGYLYNIAIGSKSCKSQHSLPLGIGTIGIVVDDNSCKFQSWYKVIVLTIELIGGLIQSQYTKDIGKIQSNGTGRESYQVIIVGIVVVGRRMLLEWFPLQSIE